MIGFRRRVIQLTTEMTYRGRRKVAGCRHYMVRGTLFPGPNTTAIPTERRPYQGHGEELEKEEEWSGPKTGTIL